MRGNKTKTAGEDGVNAGFDEQALAQRIDALSALAEQFDGRSADAKEGVKRLDAQQLKLAKTSEELSRRIVGLADRGAELERAVREAAELGRETENRLENIAGEFPATDARIAELRKQLGQLKSQGTQRGQRLSALNKRVKGIESSLTGMLEANASLIQRLQAVEASGGELSTLDDSVTNVRTQLSTIEQRLEGLEQDTQREATLSAVDDKLHRLESMIVAEKEAGGNSLSALEQRIESVNHDQTALERQIAGLTDESQGMASALDAMREQSLALASQLPDLQPVLERLGALEQESQPVAERQQTQQTAIERLQDRVDSLADQSHHLVQTLSSDAEQLAAMQQQLADFDGQLGQDKAAAEARLKQHLDDVEQRLGAIDQARAQLGERFDTTLDALGELKNRTDGLSAQLTALENAHGSLAGLEPQQQGLAALQESQKGDLQALRGRLESLAEAVHETTEMIAQEAEKLASVGQNVDAQSTQLHDLQQRQTQEREDAQQLSQRLEALIIEQTQQAENSQQALSALQAQFDTLAESQRLFDDAGKTLGGRVESASDELSVLQLRTSDLLDRLNNLQQVPDRLTELEARNAPLDQQLQDHQQVLSRLEQRVEQLNRQRDTLSERLEEETERLAEHAGRGEATAQKVADVEGNIEQLKQQISVLQQAQQQETQGLGGRLDELGEGHRQLADENRLLIAQLRERIEQLGEAQERIDEGGQTLVEKLDLSDERVQALQQDSQTLAQRLQDMADLPERVSQLEQRVSPIDEKLAEQGESLTNIRDLLSQLQRSTGELSERISAEAERVNQQHLESDAANQSTMAQLAKDIATCREALSLAEAKIGDLGDSGGRLQSELQETARRIADLAQRDQQRLRMIEAAQDKLGDLNTALDVNADALQRSAQRDQRQDSEIVKVQGAQRLLTWIGAAAALLLIALSLTGYWLADDKQQSQREALMAQLTALEQRLSASALGKPEQLQSLAEDMSDLKLHVRTLDSRFDDMPLLEPASDSPPPDDYALQQNNIMQALDELNARLAEIEKSPTAAATDAAAKPATRALAQQATLDEWSQAQAQARFTLQIVGVQDKAALNRFVRKYRLQEGSAYLKTEYKDHPWYVLFHGVYKNRASASAAAQQLSKRLNGARPWIRRLPKNGHIQALQSR